MTLCAEVVLSLPVNKAFAYIVPESCRERARVGSRVLVPFGKRTLTGFIIGIKKRRFFPGLDLKQVIEVLDEEPVFSRRFLSFTRSLSDEFFSSWGELLQSSLPPTYILKSQITVRLAEGGRAALEEEHPTGKEKELLQWLGRRPYALSFLRKKLKVKSFHSFLARLEKKGWVQTQREVRTARRRKTSQTATRVPTQLEMDFSLDSSSRRAAEKMTSAAGRERFSPFFLFGPPAKRESVYFELIRKTLEAKRRILFLVPEITLTEDLVAEFEKRLGGRAALLHSRLPERKREREWIKIREKKAEVVVGPRSALLSPLENLGLVIVDEEQDGSYFQAESPSYDARRGAWLRAKKEHCLLVYGSEFPSVSSFFRAKKGGRLVSLESEQKKKKVEILDDRRARGILSGRLKDKIAERLKKKEPLVVFLNRKGYASSLFCSRCRFIPRCVRCDIALAYHRKKEELVCHYCHYSLPRMASCPDCGSRLIKERGVGVEAVEEELRKVFPQARVSCLTADSRRNEQEKVVGRFEKGQVDVLVGTQLLAHQAGLPEVSLVAVLFPETILTLSDYRASERTYQTISQMMRFIGSGPEAEMVIQTGLPDHFSIRLAAAADYPAFFARELEFRRLMNYPPFSAMAEILFQGENLRRVASQSREFLGRLRECCGEIETLGASLAPVARLRGMSRIQVILRARSRRELEKALKKLWPAVRTRKSVRFYD